MSRASEVRALRKELLMLRSEQLRLAVRQDLDALRPVDVLLGTQGRVEWFETVAGLLGPLLPRRFGRWVTLALQGWNLVRRISKVRLRV